MILSTVGDPSGAMVPSSALRSKGPDSSFALSACCGRPPSGPGEGGAGSGRWSNPGLGGRLCLVLLFVLSVPTQPLASDYFGLGSRNAALSGAVSADCEDGAAAWYNPASLAVAPGAVGLFYTSMFSGVSTSLESPGSLGHIPTFQLRDADGMLDQGASQGAVDEAAQAAGDLERFSGIGMSFVLPLGRLFPALPVPAALGGTVLVPGDGGSLAHFSGNRADRPFFPTFNTPFNQARIHFGLGSTLWPDHLWLGGGTSVHSRVNGTFSTQNPVASYDPAHPDKNPPAPSQADTSQRLDLAASWTAGILARPLPWAGIALVYHSAEETSMDMNIEAVMELDLGEPVRVEVPYQMTGAFAWRPHRLLAGLTATPPDTGLTITAEVEFALWKQFEEHIQVLELKVPDEALSQESTLYIDDLGGWFRVDSTGRPAARLRNTWTPRAGLEYRWTNGLAVRGGYSFRPSPLEPDQQYRNMLLDNSWHSVTLGTGVRLLRKGETRPELSLSAHAQGIYLVPRDNAVGATGGGSSPYARGLIRSEGFLAGGGLELTASF